MKCIHLSLLLLSPGVLAAATLVVDPAGGGDFKTIQPAIDAAADGDRVQVKPVSISSPSRSTSTAPTCRETRRARR